MRRRSDHAVTTTAAMPMTRVSGEQANLARVLRCQVAPAGAVTAARANNRKIPVLKRMEFLSDSHRQGAPRE